GLTTVLLSGHKSVEILFMLLTEALKGAGLARFITKGQTLKRQKAREFAKGVLPDPPALDQRGKEFKWDTYFVASKRAAEIKKLMTAKPTRSKSADYNQVFIDTVWTRAFLEYRRFWYGNPDMVRDVR